MRVTQSLTENRESGSAIPGLTGGGLATTAGGGLATTAGGGLVTAAGGGLATTAGGGRVIGVSGGREAETGGGRVVGVSGDRAAGTGGDLVTGGLLKGGGDEEVDDGGVGLRFGHSPSMNLKLSNLPARVLVMSLPKPASYVIL